MSWQSEALATQSDGMGRATRRPVVCSVSGTVYQFDGKGLVEGDDKSNSGCTAGRVRSCPTAVDVPLETADGKTVSEHVMIATRQLANVCVLSFIV